MRYLAPSILSADLSNLSQQVKLVEEGGADWIHCDIMDGHFVPNITFGPIMVKAVKKCTKLTVDTHLMIEEPDKYLDDFVKAGADYITVHQEAVIHLNRTLNHIKELGVKAGVSINPSTPVELLKEILEYVDLVLIMSVNPGFGGQKFIPGALLKIKELIKFREQQKLSFLIEIDGGINKKTISQAVDAGVDVFVAGSSIFKSDNITASTAELKSYLKT